MAKRQVFYSFHYGDDVMRVQQIRNMGIFEDNRPFSPNEWEEVRYQEDEKIKAWIDNHMQYRSCVIVLIGEKTSKAKWVKYEIKKAWKERKALLGIYIHNLKCPRGGTCSKGENPFSRFALKDGTRLSEYVPCFDPDPENAYTEIKENISLWIEKAIEVSKENYSKTKESYFRELKQKAA